MAKLIGMILIVSSVLIIIAGAFIGAKYGNNAKISGNAVSDILAQPKADLGFFDYIGAFALSYSIVSFIMGMFFLFRI